jgi:hypothetical protein
VNHQLRLHWTQALACLQGVVRPDQRTWVLQQVEGESLLQDDIRQLHAIRRRLAPLCRWLRRLE